MRLSLDSLSVLDAIDREGSFAAAAEVLHRVPSAVTYAVQKLEEDLDVQLFDRSGHRAQLTEAGRELLREGRRLLGAASELEARVKRVATGYEVELRIAVSDLIPIERLHPVFDQFYRNACGTRLKILTEVFGGGWDALATNRVDLSIGAPGEGPVGGGYGMAPLGSVVFDFMLAPQHPLAALPEPLRTEDVQKYRAVSAADSSRHLPARTSGLLSGQDVLTLPDMRAKVAAQVAGLGVGFIPRNLGRPEVEAGRLVVRMVEEPKSDVPLLIAWRSGARGMALAWFIERLRDSELQRALLA